MGSMCYANEIYTSLGMKQYFSKTNSTPYEIVSCYVLKDEF